MHCIPRFCWLFIFVCQLISKQNGQIIPPSVEDAVDPNALAGNVVKDHVVSADQIAVQDLYIGCIQRRAGVGELLQSLDSSLDFPDQIPGGGTVVEPVAM